MKKENRSIEQIVNEQLSKWTFRSKEGKSEIVEPKQFITISREPGTGGTGNCQAAFGTAEDGTVRRADCHNRLRKVPR